MFETATLRTEKQNEEAQKMHQLTTNLVLGLFIGPGIDQQPDAVCATVRSGTHQRRPSGLSRICRHAQIALALAHKHIHHTKTHTNTNTQIIETSTDNKRNGKYRK
jgi:hypothetical protein